MDGIEMRTANESAVAGRAGSGMNILLAISGHITIWSTRKYKQFAAIQRH
jgi:hypothetical protein